LGFAPLRGGSVGDDVAGAVHDVASQSHGSSKPKACAASASSKAPAGTSTGPSSTSSPSSKQSAATASTPSPFPCAIARNRVRRARETMITTGILSDERAMGGLVRGRRRLTHATGTRYPQAAATEAATEGFDSTPGGNCVS